LTTSAADSVRTSMRRHLSLLGASCLARSQPPTRSRETVNHDDHLRPLVLLPTETRRFRQAGEGSQGQVTGTLAENI
jgi:hypothetical protein